MPPPDVLLTWATAAANDWRWLAITWHVLLTAPFLMIVAGWRPSARLLGYLVVAPLVSVSMVAWLSGNPFNGTVFAVVSMGLLVAAFRSATTAVSIERLEWAAPGAAFALLGWAYPHFVRVEAWTTYAYASPLGLLPCPTLLFAIGTTLIFQSFSSAAWKVPLVIAGLLYGAIGVFRLGVVLDWGLLLASATLAAALLRDIVGRRSVRAEQPIRPAQPLSAQRHDV